MSSKILVTGATGRIGARLVATLVENGNFVRSLLAPNDPAEGRLSSIETEIVRGDLLNGDFTSAFRGMDAVVHLASLMGSEKSVGRQKFFDVNVRGTFALLDAAIISNIKKFVFMSSTAVYDTMTVDEFPASETAPIRPTTLYGLTKVLGERMALQFHFQHSLPVVILRTNFVQAGDEAVNGWTAGYALNRLRVISKTPQATAFSQGLSYPNPLSARLEKDLDQLLIPRGPNGESWCEHRTDVRDVVRGIVLALQTTNGIGEAFNVCGREIMPREEVVPYLAARLGQPYLDERFPVLFRYAFSNKKAEAMLGYRPEFGWKEMIDSALDVRSAKGGSR